MFQQDHPADGKTVHWRSLYSAPRAGLITPNPRCPLWDKMSIHCFPECTIHLQEKTNSLVAPGGACYSRRVQSAIANLLVVAGWPPNSNLHRETPSSNTLVPSVQCRFVPCGLFPLTLSWPRSTFRMQMTKPGGVGDASRSFTGVFCCSVPAARAPVLGQPSSEHTLTGKHKGWPFSLFPKLLTLCTSPHSTK